MYTITIPLTRTAPVTINWGDGTADVTYPATGPISYTYQTSGSFDVTVFLNSPTHMTNFTTNGWADRAKVIDVKQWGESNFTGGSNFTQTSLTKISAPDYPRRLVTASSFFSNCALLENVGNFRVDNVTDMNSMFRQCPVFNQNINHWKTSNLVYVERLFNGCYEFNSPLDQWDTSKIAGSMFLSFAFCSKFNQSLNNWDVSRITNMQGTFRDALIYNQPMNNWDVRKVTTMTTMFYNAPKFNQDLSSWQIPLVTNLAQFMQLATDYSTANTDALLNSFAGQTTQNNVACTNAFRPRTSASNAAVATLQSRGWTGIV